MNQRSDYKAFVSSTFLDLKDHRAHVIRALRKAGFFVDPMEEWTASADEPKEFSRQRLESCHLCILLIARRRGHVPSGGTRSITQQEYDEACRLGIDILPYVLDDSVSDEDWPWEDREQVEAWRADVREHFGVETFKKTPSTIDIAPALTRWVTEQGPKTALRLYLEGVKQEHGFIRFVSLPRLEDNADAPIQRLYVEPAVAERAVSPDVDPSEWPETTPILDALAEHQRLVLLGDPGSGKSTLTSWLSWQLAKHHESGNEWTERLGKLIPIPMILRDLGIGKGITWEGLLEKFAKTPLGRLLTLPNLERVLRDDKAMIILDGLDEIGNRQVRQDLRAAAWSAMATGHASRWILTSRIVGYDDVAFHFRHVIGGWDDDELPTSYVERFATCLYVAPFDNPRVDRFAQNWFVLREKTDHRARTQAQELLEAIRSDEATTKLGRIPNLLTMMALIYRVRARLPHGRALLYSEIAQAYLETIDGWRRLLDRPKTETLQDRRRWLARVGFEMQRKRVATGETEGKEILASGDEVRRWVAAAMSETGSNGSEEDAAEFVDYLARRSGLLLPRGQDQFAFLHLSFQEYFAAVFLQNQIASPLWDRGDDRVAKGASKSDLHHYGGETVWRETLVFLVELVAASEQPLWLDPILTTLFGKGFRQLPAEIEGSTGQEQALLLARLAIDPHAGFSIEQREQAIDQCCRREIVLMNIAAKNRLFRLIHTNQVLRLFFENDLLTHSALLQNISKHVDHQKATWLDLAVTSVRDLSPLVGLTTLRRLDLQRTSVCDVEALGKLNSLTHLSLRGTEVADLSPISRLTLLESLVLSGTNIVDFASLPNMNSLQELDLSNTRISDLSAVSRVKSLVGLDLEGTNVFDVRCLAALNSLKRLNLSRTAVINIDSLAKIASLEQVDLREADVKQSSVDQFQSTRQKLRLPMCHIDL